MSKTKKWCSHFTLIYSHKGDKTSVYVLGSYVHIYHNNINNLNQSSIYITYKPAAYNI
jgi:hypothetical protein